MKQAVFETYESEVRSYCRKFPAIFKTANGAIMTDNQATTTLTSSAAQFSELRPQ